LSLYIFIPNIVAITVFIITRLINPHFMFIAVSPQHITVLYPNNSTIDISPQSSTFCFSFDFFTLILSIKSWFLSNVFPHIF